MADEQPVIYLDLDGTLAQYDGWRGVLHIGDPFPTTPEKLGTRDSLKMMKQTGARLVIWTHRMNVKEDADQWKKATDTTNTRHHMLMAKHLIQKWLKKHELDEYIDYIEEIPKPGFMVLVDDRVIRHQGNWTQTLRDIVNFRPWWKDEDYKPRAREGLGESVETDPVWQKLMGTPNDKEAVQKTDS